MGDPKVTSRPAPVIRTHHTPAQPPATTHAPQSGTPAPAHGWAPPQKGGHAPAPGHAPAHGADGAHGHSVGETVLHRTEQAAHGSKIVGAAGQLAKEATAFGKAAKLGFLAPLAAPFVTFAAVKDVRTAARTGSKDDINTAIGSTAYLSSVGNETAKIGVEVAQHRAAKKAAAMAGAKTAAHIGGKAAGRLVPGLSVAIAASDVVWAGTVFNDPKASTAKKAAAGVSAAASVVAAGASHIPVLGTVGAAVASGISTGALLLSSFL